VICWRRQWRTVAIFGEDGSVSLFERKRRFSVPGSINNPRCTERRSRLAIGRRRGGAPAALTVASAVLDQAEDTTIVYRNV